MSFSVGERWASSSQFGRQMTAHSQSLLWAAFECEGVLWLYFTSLAFIPLLLHTPHRLHEALHGKKTWFGRAEGHALGMPGLAESLERGHSAWALCWSMHRPRWWLLRPCERWAVLPMYVMDLIQKSPCQILLGCAMQETKLGLDDPFWP